MVSKEEYKRRMDQDEISRVENFYKGWRATLTCRNCGIAVYSRKSRQEVSCKCGYIGVEENPFFYKVCNYQSSQDKKDGLVENRACDYSFSMVLYEELREAGK